MSRSFALFYAILRWGGRFCARCPALFHAMSGKRALRAAALRRASAAKKSYEASRSYARSWAGLGAVR